ncbi:hypothetical protein B7463_g521, partial [Scytalidium lignicola]
MSDVDSDEELNRAIALSLQDSPPITHQTREGNNAVIDLISSSEDDDDDLDAPMTARVVKRDNQKPALKTAASLGQPPPGIPDRRLLGATIKKQPSSQDIESVQNSTSTSSHSSTSGDKPVQSLLQSLDRKKMEKERLARLEAFSDTGQPILSTTQTRKRKASTSFPQIDETQLVTKQRTSSGPPATKMIISSGNATRTTNQATSGIQFPHGVVKKTWAFGYPRQGDDIKIEEVLQKSDLELAVLSSFQLDADWVMSKIDILKTKLIWVLQAKDESERENWKSEAPKTFRFCFPTMEGNINCMHSKLQLLSHPSYLRIVIPSANLVPYDWGEMGGIMENVVFLIDLPRLPQGKTTPTDQLTAFGKELLYFLTAMGIDQTTVDSIRNFDFTNTSKLAFVHSIGGSHTGMSLKRTGYPGLGTAIKMLGLCRDGPLLVDYIAASIGNLKSSFLQSIYLAAKVLEEIENWFRIYFPTRETVTQSKGGSNAGGTICFQSRWYDAATFPRSLMIDCKSKRPGLLMHNKMMFVRPHDLPSTSSKANQQHSTGWAYVGSANLSEGAWGRVVKDRITKEHKLNCRNWECGVVIPMPSASTSEQKPSGYANNGLEIFNDRVPVPMVIPGEPYGLRRPWFYNGE